MGIPLLWVMGGCSSQLETTILSQKAPPKPEVTPVQEKPPVTSPSPVVSEAKIEEKKLAVPPPEIPVEEPPKPVIREGAPEPVVAVAPAKVEEAKPAVQPPPPQPAEPFAAGLPPIYVDPLSPAQPTIRSGPPTEIAKSEPEPVKGPEVAALAPPEEVGQGLPPIYVDPLLPAQPTIREGSPEEPVTREPEPPVVETPLEVAKLEPEAPVVVLDSITDVYFDYDRFSLRDDAIQRLDANAKMLSGQLAGRKVIIEGHCDERGTRSYNMILGERRAQTVRKFLIDLGVPEENLEAVSYGKEKPFCTDHTMECWQENRRGHFVVR